MFSGIGGAVEAEAMAIFAGGKSLAKDLGEVLGRNANTIIADLDLNAVIAVGAGAKG